MLANCEPISRAAWSTASSAIEIMAGVGYLAHGRARASRAARTRIASASSHSSVWRVADGSG
jgi:hypothetical protein